MEFLRLLFAVVHSFWGSFSKSKYRLDSDLFNCICQTQKTPATLGVTGVFWYGLWLLKLEIVWAFDFFETEFSDISGLTYHPFYAFNCFFFRVAAASKRLSARVQSDSHHEIIVRLLLTKQFKLHRR
jgi:hypothetical protein